MNGLVNAATATLAGVRGPPLAMKDLAIPRGDCFRMGAAFAALRANAIQPMVIFGPALTAKAPLPVVNNLVNQTALTALSPTLDDFPLVVFVAHPATACTTAADPSVTEETAQVHNPFLV